MLRTWRRIFSRIIYSKIDALVVVTFENSLDYFSNINAFLIDRTTIIGERPGSIDSQCCRGQKRRVERRIERKLLRAVEIHAEKLIIHFSLLLYSGSCL